MRVFSIINYCTCIFCLSSFQIILYQKTIFYGGENNKINFDFIKTNNSYEATNEDLEYFKLTFEKILFDKSFIEMFDISKIRKFIVEIS